MLNNVGFTHRNVVSVADQENAVLYDHLPNCPGSGTAKGAAAITLFYWLIIYFHVLSFPIPPGIFGIPSRPGTSGIRRFPPRFLDLLFEEMALPLGDLESHSWQQNPLLPNQVKQSSAFLYLVLAGIRP